MVASCHEHFWESQGIDVQPKFPSYSWSPDTTSQSVYLPEIMVLWIVSSFPSSQPLLQRCAAGGLARLICAFFVLFTNKITPQHFFLE